MASGPDPDLVADCVHCGFCLPACPTYLLWGEEMDSPRGRIYLMQAGLEGAATTDAVVTHFDRCLGCLACVSACPSGVQYDRLIEATRAQVEQDHRRSLRERLVRTAVFALFPYPRRLRWLRPLLAVQRRVARTRRAPQPVPQPAQQAQQAQQPTPQRAQQPAQQRPGQPNTPVQPRLPAQLLAAARLVPDKVARADRRRLTGTAAQPPARARVGMLLGCVQREYFPGVNAATARVLSAEGCHVVVPPRQGCCGALSLHSGREREAIRFAQQLIADFPSGLDAVVVNSAGCGSAMKSYPHLLREQKGWTQRAERFAAQVRDVAEWLVELGPRAPRHPLPISVAYQDACHLAHGQGVRDQPRTLLAAVPELKLEALAEPELCCGSAGVYNLLQPDPARVLGARKAAHVIAAGADLLVSANPGCLLQLRAALHDAGRHQPIAHTVEVLDASIRDLGPTALTRR